MFDNLATSLAPITQPLPRATADSGAIDRVLTQVFIIAGVLAVLFVVVGAIRYAASQGNPEQIKQAKNTIIYAVVGAVITMFAFVIVQFVTGRLTG